MHLKKELMMIMLLIYTLVLSIIIFKGFYKSIPFMAPFSVRKSTEFLSTSIQIESLPFYFNQEKINLFAFFINFIFLSFFSLTLLPELISSQVASCQDYDFWDENSRSIFIEKDSNFKELEKIIRQQPELKKSIYNNRYDNFYYEKVKNVNNNLMELNKVSNVEYPFLFNLNYLHIIISKPSQVLEGITMEFSSINREYKSFIEKNFHEINTGRDFVGDMKYMYKNIHVKILDMLYLTSNAYNKAILPFFTPISDDLLSKILLKNMDGKNIKIDTIIKSFLGLNPYSKEIISFSEQADDLFSILEYIGKISKKNYAILSKEKNTSYFFYNNNKNQQNDNLQLNSTNTYIGKYIKIKKNTGTFTYETVVRKTDVNIQKVYAFSNKISLSISDENNLSIFNIQKNIDKFHNNLKNSSKQGLNEINYKAIKERGFFLEGKINYNSDSDDYDYGDMI